MAILLAKSNEPPFMEITDLNPFASSFPFFGSGEIYEEIKTLYIVAVGQPLIYYELKAVDIPPGFQVMFSKDKNWSDRLKEKGDPIIIDGTGNYAVLPVHIKIRFHDTVDFNQIGNFKMRLILTYA